MTHADMRPHPVRAHGRHAEDWQRLGDYVTQLRRAAGYETMRAFAEACGIHEKTLGKLETGQAVNRNTLAAVETGLHKRPGWCNGVLDQVDLEGGMNGEQEPILQNKIERELWAELLLINALTHDERLHLLESYRKYAGRLGQAGEGYGNNVTDE